MKVLIDKWVDGVKVGRKAVACRILKDRGSTILVELADGNVISRKKVRDLVEEN